MKFTTSSSELLQGLLSISKVIANKNTIPALNDFLLVLKGNSLEVTASDAEMTLKTTIIINDVEEEGEIAIPAKHLTDSLKEFPNLPLTFKANPGENILEITWLSGAYQIPYHSPEDYPVYNHFPTEARSLTIAADALLSGINSTIYATAEEELRPIMNGIYFDIFTDSISMVASDSQKLVCYSRTDMKSEEEFSFILTKKPASILRGILPKIDGDVKITFDSKSALFEFQDHIMVCRLLEGKYPPYKSVIPTNNPNRLYINRTDLLNTVKRVAVCSNQAGPVIKLTLSFNNLVISAQDLKLSTHAHETISCQYDGDPMSIGFKPVYLIEILSNLHFEEIVLELSEPTRAALILNAGEKDDIENICSLLMPVRI